MNKLPKDDCCGCGCCNLVCPFGAIDMVMNDEGFLRPVIDDDKCRKCGLCEKKCPILKGENKHENTNYRIYAAYNKDKKILKKSSSGGVFYEIAYSVISNGGVVYGVSFNNKKYAHHIRIDNINGLDKILGSKYLQSPSYRVFESIKNDLKVGLTVLFSGTPCQIDSLKSFLGKKYDNLITVDFICTGVPSLRVFNEYIAYLENKYNDEFIDIDFRYKKKGWYNYFIKINFKHKSILESRFFNPLLILHYNHISVRKSCFNCHFRNGSSSSDIQLGDFWNVDIVNNNIYNRNGVSVLIIKSDLGNELFSKIKNNLVFCEMSEDDLKSTNKSYCDFVMKTDKRDNFFDELLSSEDKYRIINSWTSFSFSKKIRILKNLLILRLKRK